MTTAKIMPFKNPTTVSRRITRQTLAPVRSRVASPRTATAMDCVPAFPPIEATIGHQHGKCDQRFDGRLEYGDDQRSDDRGQQVYPQPWQTLPCGFNHPVRQAAFTGTGHAQHVFFMFFIQHRHRIIDGDDTDQAAIGIDHGGPKSGDTG